MKNYIPIPSELRTPSTSIINPPIETRVQELPFNQLEWKDFEKLCLCLIELDETVEFCQFYGIPGQGQEGIDIYARSKFNKKYSVYQCKKVKNFGPSQIKSAVSKFINGNWIDKSDKFVLCISEGFDTKNRADELERQTRILSEKRIKLVPWDKYVLSKKLKENPKIVDDFFGREWVNAFCGPDVANTLRKHQDINEVIKIRKELKNFYEQIFNQHDHGFPINLSMNHLSLKDRFIFPDINDVKFVETLEKLSSEKSDSPNENISELTNKGNRLIKHYSTLEYQQRQGFENWLYTSNNSIILGGPGSGKSTLLRFITIDLLNNSPKLKLLSKKWGQLIPIWIPFAFWTKRILDDDLDSFPLEGFIHSWLIKTWGKDDLWPLIKKALDDKKILLLVDGLDEWTDEQSAKSALNRLITFIKSYDVPSIVSSRPHSFEKLGIKNIEWQIGNLSDFNYKQQEQLSKLWFGTLLKNRFGNSNESVLKLKAKFETERLLSELSSSPELKELAKIPLLLCLMIYHKYQGYHLPQSRFKAYDSLIDHLIKEHPEMRRNAADITTDQFELDVNEIKLILEYLAYNIQEHFKNGIINHNEANSILENFLKDLEGDFRFAPYKARDYSRRILEINEENWGLLVKQSPNEIGFLHRVFQEYLAGSYISHKSQNEQEIILKTYCTDPQWRDVILSLFSVTNNSSDVEYLIETIRSISEETNKFNQHSIELILYEIAFGNFNCSERLSKELAFEAFEKVELGSWMPQRERIIRLIMNGLISPHVKELVQSKIKEWFPNRYHWKSYIYNAMKDWPKTSEVIKCLWNGIHDETINNQRASANTLASIANGDLEIGNDLLFLAKKAENSRVRAVAIESLLKGWDDQKELNNILKDARNSESPELRLISIFGRINKKIQTKKDQTELIQLGSGRNLSTFAWEKDIVEYLLKGWPGSNIIKEICIKSLKNGLTRKKKLNSEISLTVLIKGYPNDNEVANFFVEQFKEKNDPLIVIRDEMYLHKKLAENFKDHPQLVNTIDSWAENAETIDISNISLLASMGRTKKIKHILLKALDQNNYNSRWAAHSLIKNWGMEDVEVREKLTNFISESNKKASLIGHLIPKIIKDKIKCRKKLLELLNDTTHHNHYFVLSGFKDLTDVDDDKEVVNTVLDMPFLMNNEMVIQTLIENYPLNQRVKELSIEELSKRDDGFSNIGIIATNYKDDLIIRKKIIHRMCSLPSNLREIIVKYLGEANSDNEFAISILKLYDHEENDTVKTQASISYYNLLKASNRNFDSDLDYLLNTIDAVGFDHEERRRAAFCGLVILNHLELYKSTPPYSIFGYYKQNIPFLRLILENWEYLKNSWGDDFWFKTPTDTLKQCHWDQLCLLADEFPIPKNEAIDCIKNKDTNRIHVNILNFLSRACPGSLLLLDCCLKALETEPKKYGSLEIIITATKILGEHFNGDKEILEHIMSSIPLSYTTAILVLCEGWPESEILTEIYTEVEDRQIKLGSFTYLQLICQKETSRFIFNKLSSSFSDSSFENMPSWLIKEHRRPLIRRIQEDNEFLETLIKSLNNNPYPSLKVTIPQLISASGKMNQKIREWCIEELENQLNYVDSPEIGMDLVSGEIRPVSHSLLDIL